MRIYTGLALFLGLSTCLAASGCSIKKFAVNKVGDALAEGGSTWESDDDIELMLTMGRLRIWRGNPPQLAQLVKRQRLLSSLKRAASRAAI